MDGKTRGALFWTFFPITVALLIALLGKSLVLHVFLWLYLPRRRAQLYLEKGSSELVEAKACRK